MSHLPYLVGHFTPSQAVQFLGPLLFPILLPYEEQLCFPARQQLSPPTLLRLSGACCKPKAESHGLDKGFCLRFPHLG